MVVSKPDTLILRVVPREASDGVQNISYLVMTPFCSMGGTIPHETVMVVEVFGSADRLDGGLDGPAILEIWNNHGH